MLTQVIATKQEPVSGSLNLPIAFGYGQNYQTIHIYNEIQHIDIGPYKYTLKIQIYIHMEPHPYNSKLHICTSYRIHVHLTAFMHIEPNTCTSYRNYTQHTSRKQIHIRRNCTYINGTIQINRNAFVIRLYFELFTCVRRACLYGGQPVSGD